MKYVTNVVPCAFIRTNWRVSESFRLMDSFHSLRRLVVIDLGSFLSYPPSTQKSSSYVHNSPQIYPLSWKKVGERDRYDSVFILSLSFDSFARSNDPRPGMPVEKWRLKKSPLFNSTLSWYEAPLTETKVVISRACNYTQNERRAHVY